MRLRGEIAFEVEEPVDMKPATFAPAAFWTGFFRDIEARLAPLDGLVLPVKFGSPREAMLCRLALANRRKASGRYVPVAKGLRTTQRRDRVFFWLEKAEVPA